MGCFSTPLTSLSPRLLQGLALQSRSILKTLLGDGKVGLFPHGHVRKGGSEAASIPRAEQTLGEGNLAPPEAHSTGQDYFRHGQTQCMGFSLAFRRRDGDAADAPHGAKAGAALPREMPPTATGQAAQSRPR